VEFPVKPRSADELKVSTDGQVNRTFRSRSLLPLALEVFDSKQRPDKLPLRSVLRLDPELANPSITAVANGSSDIRTTVVLINGNETRDWRDEAEFLGGLTRRGLGIAVVDPRGVASRRLALAIAGQDYADPLNGVEENIAYNAFLVGKSLLGMRVADVLVAVRGIIEQRRPRRVALCARRDAALVACFAAAVEPSIDMVATEQMVLSFRSYFKAEGQPINAASILPGLLPSFGDVAGVVAEITPRRILISAGAGEGLNANQSVRVVSDRFSANSRILTDWIGS
jgi:hypothetical protein